MCVPQICRCMLYNTKTTVSRLQSDSPPFVLHVHSSTHTNACEGDTNTTRAPRVVVVVAVLNRRWCEGAFLETMCRDNRFGNGCYGVQRHHLVAGRPIGNAFVDGDRGDFKTALTRLHDGPARAWSRCAAVYLAGRHGEQTLAGASLSLHCRPSRPLPVPLLTDSCLVPISQMLDCDAICSTATTCHMLQQLSVHPTVLSQLQLGPVEDPAMPDERRRLLARLAAAGNAAACYRLGLIRVYHPLSAFCFLVACQ